MKGLAFQGAHGVLPHEKEQLQRFVVDLELFLDLQAAGRADDLTLTVNYDEVFHQVERIVTQESYNLIEALAENIAAFLLLKFPLTSVEVTVYKPEAPVTGEFDYFAVKIKRSQK